MSVFHFVYPREVSFESWDWTWPELYGIGGSETSVIEMSLRLAKRGHEVNVWGPLPEPRADEAHTFLVPDTGLYTWRNVDNLTGAALEEPGIWVIYRYPEFLDNFVGVKNGDQKIWFVAQDEIYRAFSVKERSEIVDRFICLCKAHVRQTEELFPGLRGKVVRSSNGISSDRIGKLLEESKIERNQNRLFYASSPDRGLETLLHVFERAREYNPDLELEVAYGFNNIDVIIDQDLNGVGKRYERRRGDMVRKMEELGVKMLGRLPQPEVWKKWLEAGIWCYPTNFRETSCIVSMEAQALGAIPITVPCWALRDNVQYGFILPGDVKEWPVCLARFIGETVRMSLNAGWQEEIRGEMMPWALKQFDWERFVIQWELWAEGAEALI